VSSAGGLNEVPLPGTVSGLVGSVEPPPELELPLSPVLSEGC